MNKEYLIYKLSDEVKNSCKIDKEAFKKFNVKRGLRNEDGSGVLVGLTNIGNVVGYERDAEGKLTPTEGKLYYRGYELDDLVTPLLKEKRFGFEEVAFLLLSGQLPDKEELDAFKELLNDNMPLDHRTITHIIELEGSNIMNILARCVLEMYTFDPNPDDISRDNLMRQSIELIAKFPTIIAYAYNIYRHSVQGRSLHIRHPRENLSIAENFLYMMKHENYSELDARMLDLLLIIQAEHGGGNNSTFTVRVTSSTRTDTYSSIAAGIGSLKGPLHGGANIKVINMFHHLKEAIKDWGNVTELDTYLKRMLNKEAYDKTGLIYGIGHAVYTLSDPRAVELKRLAGELAIHPLDVRRKHHALIAVTLGSGGNNGRVLDGTGVDTYFVGTAFQHPVKIFQAADAAADRQRDKNFAGNAAQNIGKNRAALHAGGDIIKHQLISPGRVVIAGHLDRVGHIL